MGTLCDCRRFGSWRLHCLIFAVLLTRWTSMERFSTRPHDESGLCWRLAAGGPYKIGREL